MGDDSFKVGLVEYIEPPLPSPEEIPEIKKAIELYDEKFKAGSIEEIAIHVQRLLLHFPIRDMNERMNELVAEDYIFDLKSFPTWVVEEACIKYRRSNSYRPQVNDLIKLCKEVMWIHKYSRSRLEKMLNMARGEPQPYHDKVAELKKSGEWLRIENDYMQRVKG